MWNIGSFLMEIASSLHSTDKTGLEHNWQIGLFMSFSMVFKEPIIVWITDLKKCLEKSSLFLYIPPVIILTMKYKECHQDFPSTDRNPGQLTHWIWIV